MSLDIKAPRKPLIAANWKMHGNAESVRDFVNSLIKISSDVEVDVVFAPSYPYLQLAGDLSSSISNSFVHIAAQNIAEHEKGAFTGEVSATMLKDIGCDYVIVGHSERRTLFHEIDEMIFAKINCALANQISPILCIGETKEQYLSGKTKEVLAKQLSLVINSLDLKSLEKIVVAYEPVWAIGTGKTPQLDEIEEIHQNIRFMFAEKNVRIADSLRIVYGGSVNTENASSLFACANVDGGLIGGASLEFLAFEQIIKAFK